MDAHPRGDRLRSEVRSLYPEDRFTTAPRRRRMEYADRETDACGGDALVQIDALDEVGGFNEALMASEEP